jgi:hypothetical protein
MRGWCDLSEKEKEQVDKEMLEKSQENMFFFYRDEIKNFLSGKSIPSRTSRALYLNGILLRIGSGKLGAKYRINTVILNKYRELVNRT